MQILKTIAKAFKPLIPARAWISSKNLYHRWRYPLLWRNRKVARFEYKSTPISLVIVDPTDYIQKKQSEGTFYEEADLAALAPYFKSGGTFVDVGANTGQHSIYFAKILGARKLILFEPISETCDLLLENLKINGLIGISDISHLGTGLSDKASSASFAIDLNNLGHASLREAASGAIPTQTGDTALKDQQVDFIKIDTEGFEMKVLRGLAETIRRCRPKIYIEVDQENSQAFSEFLAASNYRVELRLKHYDFNENFLILPNTQ